MSADILYDESESVTTRFVGFIGKHSQFDLVIATTDRFFGKRLVTFIQSGRMAILDEGEAADPEYLAEVFQITLDEAAELSLFLTDSLLSF